MGSPNDGHLPAVWPLRQAPFLSRVRKMGVLQCRLQPEKWRRERPTRNPKAFLIAMLMATLLWLAIYYAGSCVLDVEVTHSPQEVQEQPTATP